MSQDIEEKIKKEMENQKEQIKKEELRKEKKIALLCGFGISKIPFKNNKISKAEIKGNNYTNKNIFQMTKRYKKEKDLEFDS